MYEYDLQQLRSADLIRQAEHQRQVREAVRARRAARREPARRTVEGENHTSRFRRQRFARAA
jgi:hypothetical protein